MEEGKDGHHWRKSMLRTPSLGNMVSGSSYHVHSTDVVSVSQGKSM